MENKKTGLNNENLIGSDYLISEPLDQIINNCGSGNTILAGPKRCGKTLTGYYFVNQMEQNGTGAIYNAINPMSAFKSRINAQELEYYAELYMSFRLYHFVKNKNMGLYERCFESGYNETSSLNADFINQLNRGHHISALYNYGELVMPLMERVKKMLGIESMNMVFDGLDGHSSMAQLAVARYFELFDKNIILTRDKMVCSDNDKRTDLISRQYNIVDLDYWKDKETVRKIIDKRLEYYIKALDDSHHILTLGQIVGDSIVDEAIEKANGNIECLLAAARIVCEDMIQFGEDPLSKDIVHFFLRKINAGVSMDKEIDEQYPQKILSL